MQSSAPASGDRIAPPKAPPQALYRVYIDDSGEKEYGPQTSRFFVYAGVVVADADETRCNGELAALKQATFGRPDVELKSNWLRMPRERQRRYLDPYRITDEKLDFFVEKLYARMAAAPVCYVAAAIDKTQMQAKYTNPYYASATAYQFLLQRYQLHLVRFNGLGHVTVDDMDGASPKNNQWRDLLRNQHSRLKKDGCPLTKLRFDNIAPELRFGDSARFHLLQIADLAAYNVLRQFRQHGENWDQPARGNLPLYRPLSRMLPRFMRGPRGELQGWGIVKWPVQHQGRWTLTPEEMRGA